MMIPDATLFVGGIHNTCNDSIEYFDIDRIPPNHSDKFLAAQAVVDKARRRNAQNAPDGFIPYRSPAMMKRPFDTLNNAPRISLKYAQNIITPRTPPALWDGAVARADCSWTDVVS